MEDYTKYSKEELVSMLEYIDDPIRYVSQIPVRLCEFLSCENCPVTIYDCDNRTEYEKTCLHATCQNELYKWMIKEIFKSKQCNSCKNQKLTSAFIRLLENDNWVIDYFLDLNAYRVTYFEDNHFKDEVWFDEYKEKEVES